MKLLFALGIMATIALATSSVVPAATLIRTPHYDSAIIHSNRVGGNFAYSTLEGHAYKTYTPVVHTQFQPVQYGYQLSPFHVSYPSTQQIFVDQPFFSQFAPVRPIEAATQPASPAQISPSVSQGNVVDEDTVAVEAA